jgi:hypothetical protein
VITLTDYWMGRDSEYPLEMTPAIEHNAEITVNLANQLLTRFGAGRKVRSGWRPPSVNAKTRGASRTSLHMSGQAIDLEDEDRQLTKWLFSNVGRTALVQLGLWMEHPTDAPTWVHVQTKPPPSGNRYFYSGVKV